MEYFKSIATFMSSFAGVENRIFDPLSTAMVAVQANRAPPQDIIIPISNHLRISGALLHDGNATACVVPCSLVVGLVKAVTFIREIDPENLSNSAPVCFILHALLRMKTDFGVVKIRHNRVTGDFDRAATIAAWHAQYAGVLTPDFEITVQNRVAGLVE